MLYEKKRFVCTTYGQFVYMLYGHKVFFHTTNGQVVYIVIDGNLSSIKHMEKFYMLYGHKCFCSCNICKKCLYVVWTETFFL